MKISCWEYFFNSAGIERKVFKTVLFCDAGSPAHTNNLIGFIRFLCHKTFLSFINKIEKKQPKVLIPFQYIRIQIEKHLYLKMHKQFLLYPIQLDSWFDCCPRFTWCISINLSFQGNYSITDVGQDSPSTLCHWCIMLIADYSLVAQHLTR